MVTTAFPTALDCTPEGRRDFGNCSGCPISFSSVQFSCSVMSDSLRPHESQHARPPCPSPTPLRLTSIESVMPSSHLILCRPLLLLPPIPPSIRVFSNESTLRTRWPKYWSFSFSIIPSKEHRYSKYGRDSNNEVWEILQSQPQLL